MHDSRIPLLGVAVTSCCALFGAACSASPPVDDKAAQVGVIEPRTEFVVEDIAAISDIELISDSQLVLLDRRSSPYITIVDPRTGVVVGRFGLSGGGPGELATPSQISLSALGPAQLEVLQANTRAVSRYDLSGDPLFIERTELRRLGLELRYPPTDVVLVAGGAVVTGECEDGAVARVGSDSDGPAMNASLMGPYLPADYPDVPVFNANRHSSAFDPQRGQLAIAYFYSSQVVVIDTLTRVVQRWQLESVGTPRRQEGSPAPGFQLGSSDVASLRVAIGGGRLAVAHCGCLGEMLDSLGRKVSVYALGGDSPVVTFDAPARVSGLALNRKGARLYVSSNSPVPRVWRYDLERVHEDRE